MSHKEKHDVELFSRLYEALPIKEDETEPMIISWHGVMGRQFISVVFPREKHRPDCYSAKERRSVWSVPGSLDMAGLMILPRQSDFEGMTSERAKAVLREVSLSDEAMAEVVKRIRNKAVDLAFDDWKQEPIVSVGIVSGEEIRFQLMVLIQ